ncbi:putative exosome complex exonuclease RRP44 [Apostichopus japonicus]|uniref:Putative exosome complex exonuclease RRP44 n=1 Tax=Stichopus japonicus TaxID=307972 RepID=A0A2G8K722_STIJA|nr:putative exosome complex exonuclease RRP44 [Apostichopus japonicus]
MDSINQLIDKLDSRVLEVEKKLDDSNKDNYELKERLAKQEEGQFLKINTDMEQYSRRNNLRIFGMKEDPNENTMDVFVKLAKEKLKLELNSDFIDRCHRLGRSTPGTNPRPILVKFLSYQHRREVIKARRNLKGSGITIKEDITMMNNRLLTETHRHVKVSNCWTVERRVIALVKSDNEEETKISINSSADLAKL